MSLTVGLVTIELRLPGTASLKAKRSVVKPLLARLRKEFNVSVAEVDGQDNWQRAVIAATCVSASAAYAHGLLTQVAKHVEIWRMDIEVVDYDIEML